MSSLSLGPDRDHAAQIVSRTWAGFDVDVTVRVIHTIRTLPSSPTVESIFHPR